MKTFTIFAILPAVMLLAGCSSSRKSLNEENSFYQKGIELRQEGRYEDAEAAFSKCLQFSPGSYKANLQLALIYEDHFQNFSSAIYHYKRFLQESNNPEDLNMAQEWLRRAEKKYFDILSLNYNNQRIEEKYLVVSEHETSPPSRGEQSNHGNNDKIAKNIGPEVLYAVDQQFSEIGDSNNLMPEWGSNSPYNVQSPSTYIVQEGDTLVRIAKNLLGDQNLWMQIFELNKDLIKSPERLQIGQELEIPQLPGE